MLCRNYVIEVIADMMKLCKVLCFPKPEESCCSQRLEELRGLGVEYLYSFGNIVIEKNLRVVGKGHSAVIALAKHSTAGVVGLKIRRVDSKRDSLEGEANLLRLAECTDFTPRIFAFTKNFIVREYIDGPTLKQLVALAASPLLKKAFAKLIEAAFELDRIGIDIVEISRPDTQVVFMCGDPEKPYFIDLESARLSPYPANVSRIVSAIVRNYVSKEAHIMEPYGKNVHKLISLSRQFKKCFEEGMRKHIVEQIINIVLNMD